MPEKRSAGNSRDTTESEEPAVAKPTEDIPQEYVAKRTEDVPQEPAAKSTEDLPWEPAAIPTEDLSQEPAQNLCRTFPRGIRQIRSWACLVLNWGNRQLNSPSLLTNGYAVKT